LKSIRQCPPWDAEAILLCVGDKGRNTFPVRSEPPKGGGGPVREQLLVGRRSKSRTQNLRLEGDNTGAGKSIGGKCEEKSKKGKISTEKRRKRLKKEELVSVKEQNARLRMEKGSDWKRSEKKWKNGR